MMADGDLNEAQRRERMKGVFEIIVLHKETDQPGNLNKIFESYGTSTLEAQVPIVDQDVAQRVTQCSEEQKAYATMALQTISAKDAMKGRLPRTRNRELRTIEVAGKILLTCGNERDRSPVDKAELDSELDEIERERARCFASRSGRTSPERFKSEPKSEPASTVLKTEARTTTRMFGSRSFLGGLERKPFIKQERQLNLDKLNEGLEEHMTRAARRVDQRCVIGGIAENARIRENFEQETEMESENIPLEDL